MTTTTAAEILNETAAFVSTALSHTDLRRRLVSLLLRRLPSSISLADSKTITLAADSLDSAADTTSSTPTGRSSSLLIAERLLPSLPETALSSLLLSLLHSLRRRHLQSALAVLDLFRLDPSAARSDVAPALFEDLFLVHLLPVLRSFDVRRSEVLSEPYDGRSIGDYVGDGDWSVVAIPTAKSLSKMSDRQASELKEIEVEYEGAMDENCRVLAKYFKEVLEIDNGGGGVGGGGGEGDDRDRNKMMIDSPPLIAKHRGKVKLVDQEDRTVTIASDRQELEVSINGRYNNPIWNETENSTESMYLPLYPQRVSAQTFSGLKCGPNSELDQSSFDDNSVQASSFSTESESESDENNREMALFELRQRQTQKQEVEQPSLAEPSCSPDNNKPMTPKDFVCPITSNVFNDPVTLETGQTYERRAIREWLERGNSTCPITRQKLRSTQLPKTNYVLKRLIASWRELDSVGPKSSAAEGPTIAELRQAISSLCTSEILEESESSVARIERFWKEVNSNNNNNNNSKAGEEFLWMLSKPEVVNGFVEILFNSVNPKVLKATIFLLSELGSREKAVIQTLTRVDSDIEGVAELFKKGLVEAVVLLYLLRDSAVDFSGLDLVTPLLGLIKCRDSDPVEMCVQPRMAAVVLLAQILEDGGERRLVSAVMSKKAVEGLVDSLGSESAQERRAAVRILVKCIEEDGKCRNVIARGAQLGPLLERFAEASNAERFETVLFLFELVKLSRRTLNEQILRIIKDEGSLSTMHTLLVYLQTAHEDQCPFVAGLLLQLDLLAEPRKMSIFREEAIESLIGCLRNKSFPGVQLAAAETIVSLQGRFTASGKPLARALLLKRAGLDKSFNSLEKIGQQDKESAKEEEEERAAENWERKAASVLVAHEFGLVFEALSEGLRSENSELSSACFVASTWLVNMLKVLPNTGVRGAARVCLLKHFVSIFNSSRETGDKAFSLLALSTFIQDPEGVSEITSHLKDISRGLRELKKSIPLATEMLKVFFEGQDSSAEIWNHKQIIEVDCSENGEVLSLICFKDKIFSGHSDGTIKVWTGKGSVLHPIVEIREHTKAVTCLTISQAGERLYSASLDRAIRVWSISDVEMDCIQVHDMKDPIQSLVVSNNIGCFVPSGNGVKVHSWNGGSKLMNSNKSVRCLALVQGRLYCGCQDNSIQEIDLATETLNTVQSGSRKLLGKASPVNAIEAHRGLLYAASSSFDGSAVKIFGTSDFNIVGTLGSSSEVRTMTISSELIYLGCKKGTVEIWGREKQNKIETLQIGTNSKVLCMALGANEEVLVVGTSDGLIQAWGLS